MEKECVIRVENIEKKYPDGTHALKNATFTIEKGEFVAILGPSGSGKSTLLHILGFLDSASKGKYFFNGIDTLTYNKKDLASLRSVSVGFVFQQFNLLPRETVYENVSLPLMYTNVPIKEWKKRIETVVEKVGLSHRIFHKAGLLSGGEKQRVAFARALIGEPDIIFADEPTGNLDSLSGKAVMELLKNIHKQGNTIILITHDEKIAKEAERQLFVEDGIVKEKKI